LENSKINNLSLLKTIDCLVMMDAIQFSLKNWSIFHSAIESFSVELCEEEIGNGFFNKKIKNKKAVFYNA